MEKKNNVDYFKTMSEADRSLTETAVDWTDKAFEGNDDCAAIARSVGKICNVVLREGEDTSVLEGICYNKSHSDGYLTQKRVKNLDESSYVYVKGDFEPLVSEETWDRCQQILTSKSARVIDENGKKHKYLAITEITNNFKTP